MLQLVNLFVEHCCDLSVSSSSACKHSEVPKSCCGVVRSRVCWVQWGGCTHSSVGEWIYCWRGAQGYLGLHILQGTGLASWRNHSKLHRGKLVIFFFQNSYAWYLYPLGFADYHRADSRFAPSQWETALLCNAVSHWLGASLESALKQIQIVNSPLLKLQFSISVYYLCKYMSLWQDMMTAWSK